MDSPTVTRATGGGKDARGDGAPGGAEEHPAGVEQEEVGPRDGRTEEPIDEGLLSPRDPPQDILDRVGAGEGRALALEHVKLAEAMEQVAPPDLPQIVADDVVWPRKRPLGSQAAVEGDLGVADGERGAVRQDSAEE